ncbi:radical SAM protein [Neorhodopirellula lusitana]|uniref:radical SAM protein n=1 Tax=Neorhodopirellula lusitana TaxID=445327 RepID=UPI00384C9A2B
MSEPQWSDAAIVSARGPRNSVALDRPYAMLVEPEYSAAGLIEDVATVFLANRECVFRCLMCDLWKNTTEVPMPAGAVVRQVQHAIAELPDAQHIKLYNSGNFFDSKAFPRGDLPEIASLVARYRTVIVENHPKLCNDKVIAFRDQCGTQLEVAMGLETSHAPTLSRLNKQMTVADFSQACGFLQKHEIRIRAFVLLRPPWTTESEGVQRAIESVRFAFENGVECCAVIPTRAGNGIMDRLQGSGDFQPPVLSSLESVMEETLAWRAGRVFADLWDLQRFSKCDNCFNSRYQRLQQMNLLQTVQPTVICNACSPGKV